MARTRTEHLLILGAWTLMALLNSAYASAQPAPAVVVRLAEIQIDPAQLEQLQGDPA